MRIALSVRRKDMLSLATSQEKRFAISVMESSDIAIRLSMKPVLSVKGLNLFVSVQSLENRFAVPATQKHAVIILPSMRFARIAED
jgi:hypothetical protein